MLAYLVCLKTFSKNFTMPWRVPKFSIPLFCSGSGWCASTSGNLDELAAAKILSRRSKSFFGLFRRKSSAARGEEDLEADSMEWTQNPVREDLPNGWRSELDEYGCLFFVHIETGEITRQRPGEKKKIKEWKDFKKDVARARAEKHQKANMEKLSVKGTKKNAVKRKKEFGRFEARKPGRASEIELKDRAQPSAPPPPPQMTSAPPIVRNAIPVTQNLQQNLRPHVQRQPKTSNQANTVSKDNFDWEKDEDSFSNSNPMRNKSRKEKQNKSSSDTSAAVSKDNFDWEKDEDSFSNSNPMRNKLGKEKQNKTSSDNTSAAVYDWNKDEDSFTMSNPMRGNGKKGKK